MAKTQDRNRTAYLLVRISAIIILFFLGWMIWTRIQLLNHLTHPTGRRDFEQNRVTLTAIVQEIRQSGVLADPGKEFRTILNHQAYARQESDGSISVSIMTVDNGHAGRYGYLYSIRPPEKSEDDEHGIWDVPGDLPFVGDRVADNWWEVYNNLD